MQLYQILQICLLALVSRYPDSRLDINTALLDLQGSKAKMRTHYIPPLK